MFSVKLFSLYLCQLGLRTAESNVVNSIVYQQSVTEYHDLCCSNSFGMVFTIKVLLQSQSAKGMVMGCCK